MGSGKLKDREMRNGHKEMFTGARRDSLPLRLELVRKHSCEGSAGVSLNRHNLDANTLCKNRSRLDAGQRQSPLSRRRTQDRVYFHKAILDIKSAFKAPGLRTESAFRTQDSGQKLLYLSPAS